MRLASVLWIAIVPACATSPLEERLDEPDVAVTRDCTGGTNEVEVEGTVVDFVTGEPVPGANVVLTEAWSDAHSFPTAGCRLGAATTDADGHFGPLTVRARASSPVVVFLVSGAGRAPTISDTTVGCLFGCTRTNHEIAAPAQDLADAWRNDLYDGGMEYALNRGLVAYKFHDVTGNPASDVHPMYVPSFLSDRCALAAGSEVRFLEADRQTLAPPDRTTTLTAGTALIGSDARDGGYFRVAGERGAERWASVGVIVATGWIYFESDTVD